MNDSSSIKLRIEQAFRGVAYPGDWCLVNRLEGDEPRRLAQEFRGRDDWRILDPAFIDQSPDGLGSALSFFSDEAFHFYLPAYLFADLDGNLRQADPVFHLTHGLESVSRCEKINPIRYGERTWSDYAHYRFSIFNVKECAAVSAYLRAMRGTDVLTDMEKKSIDEALEQYWSGRSG
jgi:hypothetical protein